MKSKQIFLLALFLYLLLVPLTFHPDIKVIFYQSQFLTKGVVNIYQFFESNPDMAYLGPFVYPPLAYFVYGILFIPTKILAGGMFTSWLAMGNDAVSVEHIFRYLFAMKLPAILMLFGVGIVLERLFEKESDKIIHDLQLLGKDNLEPSSFIPIRSGSLVTLLKPGSNLRAELESKYGVDGIDVIMAVDGKKDHGARSPAWTPCAGSDATLPLIKTYLTPKRYG